MGNRTVFEHALNALSHPVSISAILLLLLNALVLQPNSPSWWTGKLGDAAWLVFVPFLVALCLGALIRDERTAGWAAIILTGLVFSAVKTIPPLNAVIQQVFSFTGTLAKLALDSTDLIALPGLALAGWVWRHPRSPAHRRGRAFGVLALATYAVLADTPAPTSLGIACLSEPSPMVYAINRSRYSQYFGEPKDLYALYTTGDGGLTWTSAGSFDSTNWKGPDKEDPCAGRMHDKTWTLFDSSNKDVEYLFLSPKGIYASDDGGKTYRREASADQVVDAVVDPTTRNVIAAIGGGNVLVRTSDGQWKKVQAVPTGY